MTARAAVLAALVSASSLPGSPVLGETRGPGIAAPPAVMGDGPGVLREDVEALVAQSTLTERDQRTARDILDRAEREQVRLRADLEIVRIDVRRAAASPVPDEARLAAWMRKASALEGELRRSRITAWLRLRRLLPEADRPHLDELVRSQTPAAAAARVDACRAEEGFLSINTKPYSRIFVDGELIGNTPLLRVPLTPGRHFIRAISSDGDERDIQVEVQAGNEARWIFHW